MWIANGVEFICFSFNTNTSVIQALDWAVNIVDYNVVDVSMFVQLW